MTPAEYRKALDVVALQTMRESGFPIEIEKLDDFILDDPIIRENCNGINVSRGNV